MKVYFGSVYAPCISRLTAISRYQSETARIRAHRRILEILDLAGNILEPCHAHFGVGGDDERGGETEQHDDQRQERRSVPVHGGQNPGVGSDTDASRSSSLMKNGMGRWRNDRVILIVERGHPGGR